MKNLVAITCLLALCAVTLAYPQQPTGSRTGPPSVSSRPTNPNVDRIRQGLIEKLCAKKYQTSTVGTTKKPATATEPQRKTRQAPTFGPTCSDFDKLPFEELIEKVKGGLRPVNPRP